MPQMALEWLILSVPSSYDIGSDRLMPETSNHNEQTPEEQQTLPEDCESADDQSAMQLWQPQSSAAPEPPQTWNPQDHLSNDDKQPLDWDNPNQFANQFDQERQDQQQVNTLLQSMQLFSSMSQQDALDFSSARRLITIAQITALVSLLFGGVVLSAASIVVAIVGYRKLSLIASNYPHEPALQGMIRRPGALAIIMSVFALVLNIISLIAVYPLILQALQSGDLSTLFQSSSAQLSTAPAPAPSPGDSLFG